MQEIIAQVQKAIRRPKQVFGGIFSWVFSKSPLPDYIYLKILYWLKTGKKLDLISPILFNEKVQWLKLYDRNPDYPIFVDKYEVRKYISKTIGEEYLIPLYGIWDSFEEIHFDMLPDQFVLKCTHDFDSIIICRDKNSLDLKKTAKYLKKRLAKNHYWKCREWHYKHVRPRIIAEQLLLDESGFELKDYKIFCFNGFPRIIQVDIDRFTNHKRNLYTPQWQFQHINLGYLSDLKKDIPKPLCLDKMLDLARKLSAGKIHVRVDFYIIDMRIYFGELTFYHAGGYQRFDPPEWNKIFGDWMVLPN